MRVLIEVDSVETAAKVAAFLGAPATVAAPAAPSLPPAVVAAPPPPAAAPPAPPAAAAPPAPPPAAAAPPPPPPATKAKGPVPDGWTEGHITAMAKQYGGKFGPEALATLIAQHDPNAKKAKDVDPPAWPQFYYAMQAALQSAG